MRLQLYVIEIGIVAALAGDVIPRAAAQNSQMESAARQMEQTQSAMAASIQKQMANFRKPGTDGARATSGGFFVTESSLTPSDGSPLADCDPMSPLQIESMVTRAAATEHVSADLIRAVIRQESGGRPCAVSSAGAVGLMQLMPGTAGDLGVADSLDPEANVMGGTKLLKKLLDRYSGDLNRALGAYNAGPEPVDEFQGIPPFPETVNYVDSIMHALQNTTTPH